MEAISPFSAIGALAGLGIAALGWGVDSRAGIADDHAADPGDTMQSTVVAIDHTGAYSTNKSPSPRPRRVGGAARTFARLSAAFLRPRSRP